jgi:hypothetical protein
MPLSRTSSVAFLGSLISATVGIIALSMWSLWPVWLGHRAVEEIAMAGRKRDPERFLDAVALIERLNLGLAVTENLLQLTNSPEESVRVYGVLALPCLRPKPRTAVAKLIEFVSDEKESDIVRVAAATALGVLGRDAEVAVPSLKKIRCDEAVSKALCRAVADSLLDLQFNGVDIGKFAYRGEMHRINCDAGAREIGERVLEGGDYDAWLILIEKRHP